MDKKSKKKEGKASKRKSDENSLEDSKKKSIAQRIRFEDEKAEQPVEYTVGPNQQLMQSAQMDGYEQPVFVSLKGGDPVQLGPNTVIVYEQSSGPANYSFSGNIVMDSSGRLVMTEPIYDVKSAQHEQARITVNSAQQEVEIPTTEHIELSVSEAATHSAASVGYNNPVYQYSKVTIVDESEATNESVQIVEEDATNGIDAISDEDVVKWMNPKLTDVMRKLQMNYDAGVKLLLSPTGCIQCIYFTTPSMQLAFNTVPQFLCIQTGIEFSTVMVGNAGIRHNVCLFLAEDGNGKSVIVSGGISTFGENLQWLLETFKSCNPAWRQVRCIVAEPNKHRQDVRVSFPSAHVTSNVYQICGEVTRLCLSLFQEDSTADAADDQEQRLNIYQKVKEYVLAKINSDLDANISNLKYQLLWRHCSSKLEEAMLSPDGPLTKLESWLEGENNYTNVLHKGLEKIIAKFTMVSASSNVQPESFISWFFQVANQVEEERRTFAIARLQETMNVMGGTGNAGSGSIPADTITQYACSLMSHQTTLAQRALDSANIKGNRCSPHSSISKYGTSTQECSCLFSKVFRLPCRHILMLTTELKVKTHIPFEPRWTIQHCLFGCGLESTTQNASGGQMNYEQLVVNSSVDNSQQQQHHHIQQQATMAANQQQHQQSQYVLASQATGTPQVIFCSAPGGGVPAQGGVSTPAGVSSPVITSVVGGAVLTPVQTHERA